jgi:AcrR family transcriptional regulator
VAPVGTTSSSSRLPRGKHNLTREQVAQDQRQRVVAAMVDTVAEKGYAHTAVSDIIAGAQVSRATFYELFRDKDDCFRATYAFMTRMVQTAVTPPETDPADGADPFGKIEWLISSFLGLIRTSPKVARAFLIEVFAAGPEVLAERRRSMDQFGAYFAAALDGMPGPAGTGDDRVFVSQAIVDVLSTRVAVLVAAGETEKAMELKEPMMRLVHYLTDK